MAFLFFQLVNGTLFIRPAEIFPALLDLPIFNVLILGCLALAFARVARQLGVPAVRNEPITACVLGIQVLVVVSHLVHGQLRYAWQMGFDFFKVVLFYLLLVATIDSTRRLRQFLNSLTMLIAAVAVLALLDYHGAIVLHGVEHFEREEFDVSTGQTYLVRQLQGTGLFGDPNDLCLILVVGVVLCLYKMSDRRSGAARSLWLLPLALCLHVISLTYSRGGLVALLAASLILLDCLYGRRKAVFLALIVLPAAMVLFAGRQTNLDSSTGTGQARLQLWAASLAVFAHVPVFGLGQGLLAWEIGQETHNSFLHCYPDIGFVGGTLFVGMFFQSVFVLRKLGRDETSIGDPDLRHLRPYLLAIVVGYCAGMLTISRSYIAPTYMIPALVTAFVRLSAVDSPEPIQRLDSAFIRRTLVASVSCLILMQLSVRLLARYG